MMNQFFRTRSFNLMGLSALIVLHAVVATAIPANTSRGKISFLFFLSKNLKNFLRKIRIIKDHNFLHLIIAPRLQSSGEKSTRKNLFCFFYLFYRILCNFLSTSLVIFINFCWQWIITAWNALIRFGKARKIESKWKTHGKKFIHTIWSTCYHTKQATSQLRSVHPQNVAFLNFGV